MALRILHFLYCLLYIIYEFTLVFFLISVFFLYWFESNLFHFLKPYIYIYVCVCVLTLYDSIYCLTLNLMF